MYRALSFPGAPERSRHKERLEASLTELCELELLRQRQESLVLGALALVDAPCTAGQAGRGDPEAGRCAPQPAPRAHDALSLRRQLNSLNCNPCGLMAALEQQVGELSMDAEATSMDSHGEVGDSRPSSGFYELSEGQSPAGLSDSQAFGELPSHGCGRARAAYPSERPKSVGDDVASNCEGLMDSGPRTTVPRSFSAPYTSLEGITEGTGEEEPWPWDSSYFEGEPTAEDYKQARRIETYILGLIQRRALSQRPCKPRTTLCPDTRGIVRQSSLCRKEQPFIPDVRNISPALEGQPWVSRSIDEQHYGGVPLPSENHRPVLYARQRPMGLSSARSTSLDYPCEAPDPSSSEPESPQHFPSYPAPDSPPYYDQLVSAQYIPAQPCRTPTWAPTQRTSGAPKANRSGYSPELPQPRARATPKKCRFSEERSASRKPGRRACRSQSENSLFGQRGVPERKYNTVDRDSGRGSQAKAKRPQPGTTGYRRWRSTLELSQDEGEHPVDQVPRRSRKARPPTVPYPYPLGPSHSRHPMEYLEHTLLCRPDESYVQPIPGESESSLSEGDSPGSTSLSSDSDESGGLVWPQQLPPQLAPASPPAPLGGPTQPKAFVKIKASHALKKKILRFRTGSLKVMTTV
ncbi:dapper3-like [Arapaima gigas]